MNCTDLLVRYAEMLRLTQQMQVMAAQSEWDRLVEYGAERAAIADGLLKDENAVAWSQAEQDKKAEIIRSILEADEAIKGLTQAWMVELQGILGSIDTEKKLSKAYDTP